MNEILNKCLNKDRAAQKQLYLNHCDYLMSIIYRYTCDIEWSKDVLQNTFIKIFKNLEKYDPQRSSFRTWSSKIAVNESLTYLRSKDKYSYIEMKNESLADENISVQLHLKDTEKLITKLPTKYRSIINLYHFDGYSHEEIGRMLGISTSSSRSQLSRAKHLLLNEYKKTEAI